MVDKIIVLFRDHIFFEILIYAIILDTVLGVLRAIKEHDFNSSIGIDGMIRKVAMLVSVAFLIIINSITQMDFLFIVPDEYLSYLGIEQFGVCALFCLLFILFESVSILKNMSLCGLPIPTKVKKFLLKFLGDMTEELPSNDVSVVEDKKEE